MKVFLELISLEK